MSTLPTFHLAARSGLIAAATSANSILFAWRNSSATVVQQIHRIECKARVVTGYSAEFENALELRDVATFGSPAADFTTGTDLSNSASSPGFVRLSVDGLLKPKQESALATGNVRICTTTGLAHAGAPTYAAQPFGYDGCGELVAGATVAKGFYDLVWEPPVVEGRSVPKAILPSFGFVVRNPTALAAAGTLRLFVSVLWSERS